MLGAAVMTAHPGAVDLAVKPKMLADIERKHGQAMNNYWKEEFGYGIEQLTQGEAGHLRKAPTVDAIRDRITAARNAAGWAMDESRAGQTPATESEGVKRGPHQDKADAFKQLSSKELLEQYPNDPAIEAATAVQGVVCGKGRNPTLRLWPAIFSGEIDVFPGDRRSRLISSMTSVAPA
ncbi:Uncharacterised protein [Shewanella putrefaciens]|nr:Uncharacterised protein [Shewanella putrefaciens]